MCLGRGNWREMLGRDGVGWKGRLLEADSFSSFVSPGLYFCAGEKRGGRRGSTRRRECRWKGGCIRENPVCCGLDGTCTMQTGKQRSKAVLESGYIGSWKIEYDTKSVPGTVSAVWSTTCVLNQFGHRIVLLEVGSPFSRHLFQ